MKRFYYTFCEKGHRTYSDQGLVQGVLCGSCGVKMLEKCGNCGTPLTFSFNGLERPFNSGPYNFPARPHHCSSCGQKHPWTEDEVVEAANSGVWAYLHSDVVRLAHPKFEAGFYSESVLGVVTALVNQVKTIHCDVASEELDGVPLIRKAFRTSNPSLIVANLSTETGRNEQEGFSSIFVGMVQAVRNPIAHGNKVIDAKKAIRHLMTLSYLTQVLKTGRRPKKSERD